MPPLLIEDINFVVSSLSDVWASFRGKKIFITGGTGFFGSWLIEVLLAANARLDLQLSLTVLSRDPERFFLRLPHLRVPHALHWIQGDILGLSMESVRPSVTQEIQFDALIHLVTEGDERSLSRAPIAGMDLITEGTRRALDFAVAAGAKRFLFTSSGAVYGRQPEGMEFLAEDFSGAPNIEDFESPYAVGGNAKRQAEHLCAAYAREGRLETVIARGFTFVGPHLPVEGKFAVGNFLNDALLGRDLIIRGDGTPIRSYLYGADLTIWLLKLLAKGTPGRAYNVGSGQPISIRELADLIASVSGKPLHVVVSGKGNVAGPVDRYLPNVNRITEELGLRESIALRPALERSLRWMRAG